MLRMILQHTPGWVWGLLALLVVIGLAQTRSREMSPARISTLPRGAFGARR